MHLKAQTVWPVNELKAWFIATLLISDLTHLLNRSGCSPTDQTWNLCSLQQHEH